MKTGLKFDASAFLKDMKRINKKAYKAFHIGMYYALVQLNLDSKAESPTVPKSASGGNLRSDFDIEVKAGGKGYEGELIHKVPYALYQEAGQKEDGSKEVRNYTEPGSGKDFMKTKLDKYGDKYFERIAKEYNKIK